MKSFLPCIAFALLAVTGRASEVGLQSRLSEVRCTVGEDVVYTVSLSWTGQAQRFKIERLVLPRLESFEVVGSRTVNRVVVEDDVTRFQRDIETTIRPRRAGRQRIPATSLELVDESNQTQSLTTQALHLEVTAAAEVPTWVWALGALAALLGLGALVRFARPGSPETEDPAPTLEDYESRLDRLRHLQDHRAFYDGALDELRSGFSTALDREMPRERAAFFGALETESVRETVRHLANQLWEEIDNGRFNPQPPTGKDRERVLFQILDLLKEIRPPAETSGT